jgi:hypothetical protein
MSELQFPREIILEVRNDGQNLQVLERVFRSSKIKFETLSRDPIRIKLPATTRAVSVLHLLLDELKPEGTIILDRESPYKIDEEGISKLRRIAIRSLSTETSDKAMLTPKPQASQIASQREETQADISINSEVAPVSSGEGFKSNEVTTMTLSFALLIGVVAAFVALLAFFGKVEQLYATVILGVALVGAISVIHRYAGAFKKSKSS